MIAHVDDELAGFMLQETGDTLYVVVQYDSDSWWFRYVRDGVRERIEGWETHADEIVKSEIVSEKNGDTGMEYSHN